MRIKKSSKCNPNMKKITEFTLTMNFSSCPNDSSVANSPVNNFSRSLTKDSSSTRRKTSSKSKVKGQSESRHKKQLSSESELGSIKKQRGRSPRKSRDKSESESKYQSSICLVLKGSECN